MPATTYNFAIEQGTSFSIQFKYMSATNAQPINLSNHCVTLRIMPQPEDETLSIPIMTLSTISQSITPNYLFSLDPDQGIIYLKFSAEMTNSYLQPGASNPVSWTSAKYELELLTPDSFFQGSMKTIKRLLQGTISIIKRSIPANTIPGCASSFGSDSTISSEEQVSYSALDSCIGSPCEFIGGNANIYTFTNPNGSFSGDTALILKDIDYLSNPYGNSNPKYLSVNVPEDRTIDRIDVLIDRMSHSFAQDVRLLLTHSDSAVLLISNNKFNFENKLRNLSFILSDYTPLRSDVTDPEPTVNNVNNYYSSLLTNKNLGAAKPKPITKDVFPAQAFDPEDNNKNIANYAYTLSAFEDTSAQGEWRIYGIDTDSKNSGSIGAIKLIIYFKNEQSNELNNSLHCGGVTRSAEISGTGITIPGDKSSEFATNDLVVIKYTAGFSEAFTIRTITSTPSYDTMDDITIFSINSSIDGIVGSSITIDKYTPESAV